MSLKRGRSVSPADANTTGRSIWRSEPIEDRDSTFTALYSPSLSAKDLQATADIKSASHKIAAWRKPSAQRTLGPSSQQPSQTLFETGFDDDGEKWAGKKLETLLTNLKVEGAVVVARWYGGTMLGPVRFSHIENCAREAIAACRSAEADARKRQKLDAEESAQKAKLEIVLAERDRSIEVLRSLLLEKTKPKGDASSSQQTSTSAMTPRRVVDYSKMPLEVLKKLEKARDATLTFILKQIDEADAVSKANIAHADEAAEPSIPYEEPRATG